MSNKAERGFTPLSRSAEHGFTLIEMLVALAVFSIAALALLRLEGATLSNTAALRTRVIGQIVARNIAIEALTDPVAPPIGAARGEEVNAGRRWRWTRTTRLTPEPRLQQIDVTVIDDAGRPAGFLTIFRGAT